MSSIRVARAALRARSAVFQTMQKRTYADAVPDKIKLSLSLPHQVSTVDTTIAKLADNA